MIKKYKFIAFEGVEGSGKSTQAKILHEFFLNKNIKSILTREPGGTNNSEKIREILINEKLDGRTELLLNFAARIEHIEGLIKPSLAEEKIVITDRFFYSTYAYQGGGFMIDKKLIDLVRKSFIEDFKPDITFLIDIDEKIAIERTKTRNLNNKYELFDLEFHKRVRNSFLELAKNNKDIIIIDGNEKIDKISKKIQQIILT